MSRGDAVSAVTTHSYKHHGQYYTDHTVSDPNSDNTDSACQDLQPVPPMLEQGVPGPPPHPEQEERDRGREHHQEQ